MKMQITKDVDIDADTATLNIKATMDRRWIEANPDWKAQLVHTLLELLTLRDSAKPAGKP